MTRITRILVPTDFSETSDAALIYAQAAIDPLQAHTALLGEGLQPRDPLARQRMRFLFRVVPMRGVRVRRLSREGEAYGAFVREDVDVVPAAQRGVQQAERGCGARALERRIHQCEGQAFPVHVSSS